ncbi:MAG: phasin family protein [Rhodospirillaceae bacterium]|nr:phasin family protein [Rhodospirillaceae bacterium]MCA8933646.1 phasin family protein [Rhodospirillaceae bacterium]
MVDQFKPLWDMDITKMMGDFKFPGLDVEGIMATQRKNIEAVQAANKLAMEGLQAVAQRQTEILRQTMEEISKMMQDMMAAGTPEDRMAKHADLLKTAFERTLSNMREMAEMIAKSNTEAAEVISARVSENLEEIKGMAKAAK